MASEEEKELNARLKQDAFICLEEAKLKADMAAANLYMAVIKLQAAKESVLPPAISINEIIDLGDQINHAYKDIKSMIERWI